MTEQADVAVIGMGPAGEHVAGQLAEAGLDVVGIERELVGGECPYWGCVPSKMAIRAANLLAEARRVRGIAGETTVAPDWSVVADRIRREATDDWDDRVAVERFERTGGRFVRGEGRILGPGRVLAGDTELTVRRAIVVATGARPVIPPIPGLDAIPYWTNREALEAKELPSSLVVLGGGAVGLELAQAFARFGSRVTIVEALERLLPAEEPEVGEILGRVLTAEGVAVHTGAAAEAVRRDGHRFAVELPGDRVVTGEQVLVATGRRPDPVAVGLDRVGVPAGTRAAPTDGHMRVAPGVWAVGDVTEAGGFTHVGYYQAAIAVADILGRPHRPADYRAVPRVTFTDPEVGSVGLTEAQARAAGVPTTVGVAHVPSSARGWIHKAGNEGVVKLVVDRRSGVLVGATAMGPAGGEVLGMLTLAVQARTPIDELRSLIYAYPTHCRAVEDAVRALED